MLKSKFKELKDLTDIRNALSVFIFKKNIIKNYKKYCKNKIGHALIYYKTDSFSPFFNLNSYRHINGWEVYEMAKSLNKLGFWVDIIDRNINENYLPEDKYDIFIANASGDSGKFYYKYAKSLKKALKIFLATGMEGNIRNKLIQKRYEYLFSRNPQISKKIKPRRIVSLDTQKAMTVTDCIFVEGSEKSIETYKKFNKKIYRINASTHPELYFNINQLRKRKLTNFLYFGGNGNIMKGLDLMIETFSKLPDLNLYICAPKTENEFNDAFKETINKSKNIHFIGLIPVGGETFNKLSEKCSFILQPSSTEGNSTSVMTCMRKGLIPILTEEAGLEEVDSAIFIKDIRNVEKIIIQASKMNRDDMIKKSIQTYLHSFNYTGENFKKTFEKAILTALIDFGFFKN